MYINYIEVQVSLVLPTPALLLKLLFLYAKVLFCTDTKILLLEYKTFTDEFLHPWSDIEPEVLSQ